MNFNKVSMFESGLIIEASNGYDRFTDRIMFHYMMLVVVSLGLAVESINKAKMNLSI